MSIGIESDMNMFGTQDNQVPSMTANLGVAAQAGMEDYRVRIQRFVVGGDSFADVAMLENLWSVGMDPKEEGIVIISNKEFTHNDILVVVVTFLEHKTKVVHWRVGSDEKVSTPTAAEFIAESLPKE